MTISNSNRNILVTGASGFIGRHVIKLLAYKGYAITAMIHKNDLPTSIESKCKSILKVDITKERHLRKALKNIDNIDAVCHSAAYIPITHDNPTSARLCYEINALSTLRLAHLAINRGATTFLYLSTANMYSPSDRPCNEEDRIYPADVATYYMSSKLTAELYLTNLCKSSSTTLLIFRIASPYGPGEPPCKVVPTFMRQASTGKTLRLKNNGFTSMNLVFVSDIANLVADGIEKQIGGIYNVSGEGPTTLLQLAEIIQLAFPDRHLHVEIEPGLGGATSGGFPSVSIKKVKQTFGYKPTDLIDGLKEYRLFLAKSVSSLPRPQSGI